MDIPDVSNKMIDGDSVNNKDVQPTTAIAASVLENDYFYPEANGYKSITIRAATLQDAQKIYLAKRIPVKPEPEKVEAASENNKE
jgi:hypothetical protein